MSKNAEMKKRNKINFVDSVKKGEIHLDFKNAIASTKSGSSMYHIPTVYGKDDEKYSVPFPISRTSPFFVIEQESSFNLYMRYNLQKEIDEKVDPEDKTGIELIDTITKLENDLCDQLDKLPDDKKRQMYNKVGLDFNVIGKTPIRNCGIFRSCIESSKYTEFDTPDSSKVGEIIPNRSKMMSVAAWTVKSKIRGSSDLSNDSKSNDSNYNSPKNGGIPMPDVNGQLNSATGKTIFTKVYDSVGAPKAKLLDTWDDIKALIVYKQGDSRTNKTKLFATISSIETLAPSLYFSHSKIKVIWKVHSIKVYHKEEIRTEDISRATEEKNYLEYLNYVNSIAIKEPTNEHTATSSKKRTREEEDLNIPEHSEHSEEEHVSKKQKND